MDPQLLGLIRLMTIVLVPVVPALLLFIALPSKAVVSGPLQGFRINLSGAFAAYFALVFMVITTHSVWDPAPNYQVWTVEGNVTGDMESGAAQLLETRDINVNPPIISLDGAGGFKLQVTTTVGPTGNMVLPSLTLNHTGFYPLAIDLDPANRPDSASDLQIQWEPNAQAIRISHIRLRPLPSYDPNGRPAPQVALSEVKQP